MTARKEADFESAQDAYRKGDPRPLAKWVLCHELTQSQREYVARALCGDIEKIDRRTVKPTTERMLSDYSAFQWLNHTIASLGLDEHGMDFLKDADIVRKLAKKYGYQDHDSIRRALSRHKSKMKNVVPVKKNILEKDGHEKK